ncbi:threonine synthase [Desulfobaculum xiamenense]|uniref:Threonine synthase n=1 Tax=Desulfobaculum xiamenense TaxID=995050 RepID=A0A846QNN5_9BACT|nr:threonine synthase [Desulfobaculum xiamenense]NJB67015.1 threonine synthase [Desulfobaculum xiamenense]
MPEMNAFPAYRGRMEYFCLGCGARYGTEELHYTCPNCGGVFLLRDAGFDTLRERSGEEWRTVFDTRAGAKSDALRGIFRFYELMAPVMDEADIVYLGEGNTPIISSSNRLSAQLGGQRMAFKNDGQNPSASFKDRGMACAFSFLNHLIRTRNLDEILAVCASTGDTSAAAALYASYADGRIKSAVILPQGKVTPQQLAQPLGSGAVVLEVPGVFDDCMKVVEHLADNYQVALLNSKNAWRILGQESYAFEVAQWYDWDLAGKAIFVPIGNAGNITAIMSGFLKMFELGIITALPRVFGVQSHHADPVYRYYAAQPQEREWHPVTVEPSVAQAAMIGNPVSFPRVRHFAERYEAIAGPGSFQVVQVTEQAIIEGMLLANRHGHISCTQGGECLAGLIRARELRLIDAEETAVLDATAHMLKFIGFQDMYFENTFPQSYGITPDPARSNRPELVIEAAEKERLAPAEYTVACAQSVVERLGLKAR